ncbi:Endonuclease/exonuclease/phosphatase, partial [Thelephora terrestris]
MGPGLNLPSTAGTRNLDISPIAGIGHNVQGRRDPTGNRREGGSGDALRSQTETNCSVDVPTSNNRHTDDGAQAPENEQHLPEGGRLEPTPRPRNEPNGTLNQPRRKRKQLKIALVNMNGKGDTSQDKWGSINNVMKRRRIAVLGIQETHPCNVLRENVSRRFRNTLHLAHSENPIDPSRIGGISIVVNKGLVDTKKVTHREIVPGRVMMVEIPWNDCDKLRIMNIYAPVNNAEKADFWRNLRETMEQDENLQPDVMLGDFNLVENPEIDRLSNRRGTDPRAAREALSDIIVEANLTDGWRRRHPKKRGYTYTGNGQSRLDRIYTKEDLYPWCTDWKIEHPGFRTDHSLTSVQITSENMPFIGKGRWAIPVNLLKNGPLKKKTQELAMRLQDKVNSTTLTDAAANPQTALKEFKTEIVRLFRDHQRTNQPKIENAIRRLQGELKDKGDAQHLTADEIAEDSALITERIDALEKKRRDNAKLLSTARNRLEGETMSKYWARS